MTCRPARNYKDKFLGEVQRADFVVEHAVLVQVKAVASTNEQDRTEAMDALRLAGLNLGLLINSTCFPSARACTAW